MNINIEIKWLTIDFFSSKRTNSTWDNSDILGLRGGDTKLRDAVFKQNNILFL